MAAVAAVRAQLERGDELLLVIDHQDALLARARRHWPQPHHPDAGAPGGIRIVPSDGPPGLSGARNTGVARSTAGIVAFLDDDAVPRPGWLTALRARLVPGDGVPPGRTAMVGGAVIADWQTGGPPRWFPEELGWVVGCDYRGLPGNGAPIRNPIGASMAATRAALDAAGPFSARLGRKGRLPTGGEETEIAIRMRRALPGSRILRDTTAEVDHQVPASRARMGYVVRRCWHEGRSKAALAAAVGAAGALASERGHALRMVTSGTARHLAAVLRGDPWGPVRAAVGLVGLGVTAAGYLSGAATRRGTEDRAGRGAPPGREAPSGREAPPGRHEFVPLRLQDYELDEHHGPAELPRAERGQALLLVRRQGWPIGQLRLSGLPDAPDRTEWTAAVRRQLDPGGPPAEPAPPAAPPAAPPPQLATEQLTVVIATLGRNPLLPAAVRAVLAQRGGAGGQGGGRGPLRELLVVDNDPASGGTARLLAGIDDPRLRIVPEPRRGVSRARSTGLEQASSALIAFTDDDALPDPDWLCRIADTFACDPRISCVTGLVAPAELATREQLWFEEFGGFAKGHSLTAWSPGRDGPDAALLGPLGAMARAAGAPDGARPGRRGAAFPYTAGEFGSGNSMAFRAEALRAAGGFDPALGPGTPTLGGEDLDVFRAVHLAGGAIVYNPRAVVRHHHRREYAELLGQLYGYGLGLTAHLTKLLWTRPRHLPRLLARGPAAVHMLLAPGSAKNAGRSKDFPAALGRAELRGIAAGPWSYLRSRRLLAREAARSPAR